MTADFAWMPRILASIDVKASEYILENIDADSEASHGFVSELGGDCASLLMKN